MCETNGPAPPSILRQHPHRLRASTSTPASPRRTRRSVLRSDSTATSPAHPVIRFPFAARSPNVRRRRHAPREEARAVPDGRRRPRTRAPALPRVLRHAAHLRASPSTAAAPGAVVRPPPLQRRRPRHRRTGSAILARPCSGRDRRRLDLDRLALREDGRGAPGRLRAPRTRRTRPSARLDLSHLRASTSSTPPPRETPPRGREEARGAPDGRRRPRTRAPALPRVLRHAAHLRASTSTPARPRRTRRPAARLALDRGRPFSHARSAGARRRPRARCEK